MTRGGASPLPAPSQGQPVGSPDEATIATDQETPTEYQWRSTGSVPCRHPEEHVGGVVDAATDVAAGRRAEGSP